jgi:hypothetical protein
MASEAISKLLEVGGELRFVQLIGIVLNDLGQNFTKVTLLHR